MSVAPRMTADQALLAGQRVAFAGKLEGPTKREAASLVRQHGGVPVDRSDRSATMLVVGVGQLLAEEQELLDEETRAAAASGQLRILSEAEFWDWLNTSDDETSSKSLYTPAMLAELANVPVATIRRWHRRGLLVPVKEVRRLPYFSFEQLVAARQLANLIAQGMSPATLEKKLAALSRFVKGVDRSLQQLAVIAEGREVLLRQDGGLVEPNGQLRFDFDAIEVLGPSPEPVARTVSFAHSLAHQKQETTLEQILQAACECEEAGELSEAAELLRAALAAAGPSAELCFQLAELLYRLGDTTAARERYFMAVELDEDFVEARASLGCVLAELGELELAVAAFQGALLHHPHYADVHYHLARSLGELGQADEARAAWKTFLNLAPDSPWADEARRWLAMDSLPTVR